MPHILPPNRLHLTLRRNLPESMITCAKQRGETRSRRKRGPAQPVDRAIPRDQSCRLTVPDHAIVFDSRTVQRTGLFLLRLSHNLLPTNVAFALPLLLPLPCRCCCLCLAVAV